MAFKFNPFTGNLDLVDTTTAAGSDTQVQFNDGGSLAGDADLTWNKTTNVLTNRGDINLDDGGSFTTTVQCVTPTLDRTISFPNATGTVALVAGSSGQLTYNNAGAYAGLSTATIGTTGNITLSLNGASGVAPVALTGTWFAGTTPQVLIQPSTATAGAWSASGTGLGINAASGFTGSLLDLQANGTSIFRFDYPGAPRLVMGAGTANLGGNTLTTNGIDLPNARNISFSGSLVGKVIWSDVALERNQAKVVAITDGSTGTGYLKQTPVAIANLPTAGATYEGVRGFVSDASVSTFYSIVAVGTNDGGSIKVPVFCDGTNWRIG